MYSFIIPCYGSEYTIEHVISEINSSMTSENNPTPYEIILVNDYSPDHVWDVIKKLVASQHNIIGINLVRNFGQHAAIMAGLAQSTGDIIVLGDDDGQTPFNESKKLIHAINKGADCAFACYDKKRHHIFRNMGSIFNDWMTRILLNKPKQLKLNSFLSVRRVIVDEIIRYKHSFPFLGGLILRSTKNIANVPVTHRPRELGQSGYTFFKLLSLWLNGFTAFSVKPLRLSSYLGMLIAFFGFIFGGYILINKLINPLAPIGWTSIMATLLFLGGLTLLSLGLIGEYIGRIYICLNTAPQYIIREIITENPDHGISAKS